MTSARAGETSQGVEKMDKAKRRRKEVGRIGGLLCYAGGIAYAKGWQRI